MSIGLKLLFHKHFGKSQSDSSDYIIKIRIDGHFLEHFLGIQAQSQAVEIASIYMAILSVGHLKSPTNFV